MNAKTILKPALVLVVIALVITSVLAYVNSITADRINDLAIEKENEARAEVLPEADGFTEKTVTVNGEEKTYYESTNGTGYVFLTSGKGYGGAVNVMTGISADGAVSGVKITEQNETPGMGQKALKDEFTDQYKKAVPENGFTVVKNGASADNEIDAITAATITSKAVTNAVNEAIDIYKAVKEAE
ncbi:MAG: RnfABCDGE type electron transport complex subunit G [Lachnospiraceae bacterium]|nr:RnfABCDGE type electron transport complex subunit G [Lachnospiraceae bacterium]